MKSFLSTLIKFYPFSVQVAFGFPLLAINLIKVRRKLSELKSLNLNVQHVSLNNQKPTTFKPSLCCSCTFRMFNNQESIPV